MGRIRKVRTKTGRLVPFRQSRIADSIRDAVNVCGAGDSVLADELAGVVTLFLEKRYAGGEPPSLADVREMVQKVLVETGHVRIARAFQRLARQGRDRLAADEEAPRACEVISRDGGRTTPWNRDVLVRSLLRETRIADAEARVIATEVEDKLGRLGLERVTGSLIRELVDVELESQGQDALASRFRRLGVTRHDVESWLFPPSHGAPDPEEQCAGAVLADFSLDEIHGRPVARAHVDGRLHVLGLGHPQRVEQVTLDATGPLLAGARTTEEFLLSLIALLHAVRPAVRRRIVLTRFSEAFADLPRRASRTAVQRFVDRLLDHLSRTDVFGRPLFPPLTLEVHLTGDHLAAGDAPEAQTVRRLAERLLAALESRTALSGRLGVDFVLSAAPPYAWPESRVLDRLLAAARRHRGVGLLLLRDEEDAQAGARRADERRIVLDVGAAAINLPYALALADVKTLDDVTAALEGPVRLAMDAVFEKYWFLRRSAPETLRGLLARLPGGEGMRIEGAGQGGQVLLWGLPQAVHFLVGRGVVDAAGAPHLLARILSCVDYLAGEERDQVRLEMTLGGVADRDVRARFLHACDRLARDLGHEALARALVEAPHDVAPLPLASPVLDEVNGPVLSGAFLDRLGRGLPLPARGDDELANAWWLTRLFETTRLAYLEFEERAEVFEVQEKLFES